MKRFVFFWLLAAFVIAGVFSPFASPYPDGLERVAEDKGFIDKAVVRISSPFADYLIPGVENEALATALAGVIGVALAFLVTYLAAKLLRDTRPSA